MATTQQSTSRTSTSNQQTKTPKTARNKTTTKTTNDASTKSQSAAKKTATANSRLSGKEKSTVKKTSDVSGSSNKTENIKPAHAISAERRSHMIAEAAYYRAANRGFGGSNEEEDWLAAEAEIDAIINAIMNEGKLAALN